MKALVCLWAALPLRASAASALILLLVLPLLVSLGFWQLSRAEQWRVMFASHAERRAEPPVRLETLLSDADPAWRVVQLHGQFDAQHSLLLDNSIRDGKVGVELLQPFQDQASGLWVLLNRGWLPWPDRRIPPVFSTPAHRLSASAWVYAVPGTFQLKADAAAGPWPRLVTRVVPDNLWAELGRQGVAQELRMVTGMGAYRLDWPLAGMAPQKHLGYAVQWFAMAAVLFGLYLYRVWQWIKNHQSSEETSLERHDKPRQPR